MTNHPNLALVEAAYEAFAAGDMAAIGELLDDNAVWHAGGNSPISGDYVGKEAIFGFFGQIIEGTGGTFKNDVHDMLANDNHAVALINSSATRGDKELKVRAVHVSHWKNGKMTEFWNFPQDQEALDEFWS